VEFDGEDVPVLVAVVRVLAPQEGDAESLGDLDVKDKLSGLTGERKALAG
jgi:hypothetical protein